MPNSGCGDMAACVRLGGVFGKPGAAQIPDVRISYALDDQGTFGRIMKRRERMWTWGGMFRASLRRHEVVVAGGLGLSVGC